MSSYIFPTSQELFNRIKWDNKFNPYRVKIWYQDRFKPDLISAPLTEWKTADIGGDVPWHRVYKMTYSSDDNILWDRKERIYNEQVLSINNSLTPMLKFNRGLDTWDKLTTWTPDTLPDEIKIITFNILFDLYEPEITNLDLRLPLISSYLETQKASIICLQEVVPKSYEYLLQQDWVKDNYYVTDYNFGKYGQITLTKYLPTSINFLVLNTMKKVVITEFQDVSFHPLQIFNFHLTSTMAKDSLKKRSEQFQKIIDSFNHDANIMLIGDFNCDEHEIPMDKLSSFIDGWTQIHNKTKNGFTYDTEINPLAKFFSQDKIKQIRIDRIMYLKRPDTTLDISSIEMFGNDSTQTQFMSDHSGLTAEFSFKNDTKSLNLIHNSYSAIVLPLELWGLVQPIRKRYDENYNKHPPHITVFSKFFDLNSIFPLDLEKIDKIKYEPFKIVLDKAECFDDVLTVLTPSKPDELIELRNLLNSQVKLSRDYQPHLTLGFTKSLLSLKSPLNIKFTATSLSCLSKTSDDDHFKIIRRVDFVEYPRESTKQIIDWIKIICKQITPTTIECQIGGGRRLLQHEDGDLDVLLTGELDEKEFMTQFTKWGSMAQEFNWCYFASAFVNTIIMMTRGGVEINIIYDNKLLSDLRKTSMINDCDYILKLVDYPVYRELLIHIKNWAKQHMVYGMGYPAGIGYSILVAYLWTVPDPPKNLFDGIDKFFKIFSDYDWSNPVKLDPTHDFTQSSKIDSMIAIVSPTPPHTNCNRTIIKSTLKKFIKELNSKPTLDVGTKIVINLQNNNLQDLGRSIGFIKANILWIWINLEKYKIRITPNGWTKLGYDQYQYSFYVSGVTDTLHNLMNKLKVNWFIE